MSIALAIEPAISQKRGNNVEDDITWLVITPNVVRWIFSDNLVPLKSYYLFKEYYIINELNIYK